MWSPSVRSVLREAKVLRRLIGAARSVHTGSCSSDSGTKWAKPSGFDTGLKVFNSLTKQKEPLILARDGVATWYSCGPTVYDHAHLGHACSYVRFDILQRILTRLFGITVIHAMVVTDIDDKIIKRSWEENICSTVIASMYEDEFKRDMLSLKVIPPAVYLRVTENVPQIVSFIERIIENGHAYATQEGDVYFDIKSIGERYGKFGGAADSQPEPGSHKRDARDFALWKRSKAREPDWGSPWGRGRPGWHIECSTIASTVFGSHLDIHSGGIDLAFPHHENEIAQSEAYHQCGQWANYFLHSGHLHLKGSVEKMSKSLKNYITIKDFLKSYSATEFRMFCLLNKYRSAIDYSHGSMLEARSSLGSISSFMHDAQAYMKGQLQCATVQEAFLWERLAEAKSSVVKALADDFDTPQAVSALMNLVHHTNRQLQPVSKCGEGARSPAVFAAIVSYIRDVLDVFGIELLHSTKTSASSDYGSLEGVVEQLTRFRSEVRAFALARHDSPTKAGLSPDRVPLLKACDALRNDLAPLGVILKDRGAASTWEITAPSPGQRAQDEDQDRSTQDRPSNSNKSHKTRFVRFLRSFLCCTSSSTSVECCKKTSESIHTFEFVRVSRPNFLRVKHGFTRRTLTRRPTFPKRRAGLKPKMGVLQKGLCDAKVSRTGDTEMEPSPKTYQTEDMGPNNEVDADSEAAVRNGKSRPSSSEPKQTVLIDYERKKSVLRGTDPDVVLFFIHGVGGSLDIWRSQLDFFSQQGYETIALDLLGHGDSSAPKVAAAYTFYALSKEVTCIFKKYARRQNILIGHSYGTSFCIYLAHNYPERVHKMVLLSGGPPRPLWPGYGFLSSLSSCILCCLYPLLRGYFLKAGFAHQGSREIRLLKDHKAFSVSPFVLRSVMQGQYWPEGDRRYHAQIAAPTLLIHGFHDEFVTIDDGIEMATVSSGQSEPSKDTKVS